MHVGLLQAFLAILRESVHQMQNASSPQACLEAAGSVQAHILGQRIFLKTHLAVHSAAIIDTGRDVARFNALCRSKETSPSHHAMIVGQAVGT